MSNSDYVIIVTLKDVTFTSRVVTAPDALVAVARAITGMSPGDEDPMRNGEILSVRAYKCVTVSEDVDYAF